MPCKAELPSVRKYYRTKGSFRLISILNTKVKLSFKFKLKQIPAFTVVQHYFLGVNKDYKIGLVKFDRMFSLFLTGLTKNPNTCPSHPPPYQKPYHNQKTPQQPTPWENQKRPQTICFWKFDRAGLNTWGKYTPPPTRPQINSITLEWIFWRSIIKDLWGKGLNKHLRGRASA